MAGLFSMPVNAGFPSPAEDHLDDWLSLDELLVPERESTFFVRARGHSMSGVGIGNGDLLVVDRSLPARHGDIVIAVIDGEMTVKRLHRLRQELWLEAAHPDYSPFKPKDGQELFIWGVVTYSVRSHHECRRTV